MDLQTPRGGKGRLLSLGKLLVSAFLLAILFWRADRSTFLRTVQALPLKVFLGCAGLYILGYLLSTFRWQRLLLAAGIRVPLWRLTLVYFEAAFFNLFLPTLIGGDIIRGYAIYRITQGHDASIASILVDRLTGFGALILIALVTLGLAYGRIRDPQLAVMILAVTTAFSGGVAVLLHDRMKDHASGLLRGLGLARFQAKLQGMVEALQRYRGNRRALGQAMLISVLLQALIIMTYFWISTGLKLEVPIAYFFVYVPLITFAAMLPVSVAGLGVREGGAVYLFAKVGVDAATALTMSLAWFSLSLVVSSLGGFAFLLNTHSRKRVQARAR